MNVKRIYLIAPKFSTTKMRGFRKTVRIFPFRLSWNKVPLLNNSSFAGYVCTYSRIYKAVCQFAYHILKTASGDTFIMSEAAAIAVSMDI